MTPPAEVLTAFGVTAAPRRLPGGRGLTWRAGDIVLKPSDDEVESRWRAEVLAALPVSPGFRVARPVRAVDGSWLAGGWEAALAVDGEPDLSRVADVIHTGLSFHDALAHLPRPAFLDERDDPWSYGDRVAWEELPVPESPLLTTLARARRPIDAVAQLVHGDLLGNVLFASEQPPAVIDWPPYWRSTGWASAVAVVDGLCWYGASAELARRAVVRPEPDWDQLLIRALMYRIATDVAAGRPDRSTVYSPVIALVVG